MEIQSPLTVNGLEELLEKIDQLQKKVAEAKTLAEEIAKATITIEMS